MTVMIEEQRVAYCQCGARLVGASDLELFEAAGRHLAEHHPPLGESGGATGSGSRGTDEQTGISRQMGWGQ
jgi:hypothetical protein